MHSMFKEDFCFKTIPCLTETWVFVNELSHVCIPNALHVKLCYPDLGLLLEIRSFFTREGIG